MPFGRFIVSTKPNADAPAKEAFVNTLYFNISSPPVGGPDWQQLCKDIRDVWAARSWSQGRFIDVRAYDMGDDEPRPRKAIATKSQQGTTPNGAHQVCLCLSYYVDRNLPSFRGRIYLGPWGAPADVPTSSQISEVMALPDALAGIGGVNVDWSLWSPKRNEHQRINHAWCDNSWDIIRSRKMPASSRSSWSGDG